MIIFCQPLKFVLNTKYMWTSSKARKAKHIVHLPVHDPFMSSQKQQRRTPFPFDHVTSNKGKMRSDKGKQGTSHLLVFHQRLTTHSCGGLLLPPLGRRE